jgi:hypothetical protein
MDEDVIMAIRGRLAEMMVKTAPHIYRKYITLDSNNHPVLYVKLQRHYMDVSEARYYFTINS